MRKRRKRKKERNQQHHREIQRRSNPNYRLTKEMTS
jgi:hypothetical protein